MKYKYSFIVFTSLSLLLWACGAENKSEKENKSTKEKEETTEHEQVAEEIQLNQGKKWKVDDSMMVYIRKMESTLLEFRMSTEPTSHQLANSLLSNIDSLTSHCTMKGPAHDELHKWLVPFIETVNQFSKSENDYEIAEGYKEIIRSFDTFNQFFE